MKGRCESVLYHTTRGSDVQRDGFYIELTRVSANGEEEIVAEAFWSDDTNRFTIEFMHPALPFSVVEAFVAEARRLVQPTNVQHESNVLVPEV